MDSPVVGSPVTWELMKAPHRVSNGTATGYAMGLIVSHYRGIETISHPGGVMGGNAQMLKVPSAGLDVVVIVNRHDVLGMTLANEILDVCLPTLEPLVEKAGKPCVTGLYQSQTTGRVIQLFPKEGQQIVSIDGDDMPFVRDDQGRLSPVPLWGFVKQTVTLVAHGERPDGLSFSDFGNIDVLLARKPAEAAPVATIAGEYQSQTTSTTARIFGTDEAPELTMTGRFGSASYRLECLAEGIWRARAVGAMPWGGILSFDGAQGTFGYSTSRTRALNFRRRV